MHARDRSVLTVVVRLILLSAYPLRYSVQSLQIARTTPWMFVGQMNTFEVCNDLYIRACS